MQAINGFRDEPPCRERSPRDLHLEPRPPLQRPTVEWYGTYRLDCRTAGLLGMMSQAFDGYTVYMAYQNRDAILAIHNRRRRNFHLTIDIAVLLYQEFGRGAPRHALSISEKSIQKLQSKTSRLRREVKKLRRCSLNRWSVTLQNCCFRMLTTNTYNKPRHCSCSALK